MIGRALKWLSTSSPSEQPIFVSHGGRQGLMGSPAAARQREGLRLAPGLEAALLPNQHLPA